MSSANQEEITRAFNHLMKAPILIGVLRGDQYVIEVANEGILEVWGRTKEVIGTPLVEAVPELKGQGYMELLDEVRTTGKPYHAYEAPIALMRNGVEETLYFNFVYQPYYENENDSIAAGVIGVGHDVTGQVQGRKKIEESEERFRTLANSIFQLAWMANADGSTYWYNDRWYEYTGTSLDETTGSGWQAILHSDHKERVVSFVEEALSKPDPFELTCSLRGKNGLYRWFLTKASPVKNSEGTILQWIGTCTDITEQTVRFENQTTLFNNILKNSSNGISVTEMIRDKKGMIVDAKTILANDAAAKLIGFSKDELLSKSLTEIDPDILKSSYGVTCLQTLQTGEPSSVQYYFDLTGKWLELTISKMDEDHLIHIFSDITPIKETQLQLEKTVNDLRKSNTNLEEFAYAASHDLKEPIRKIQFFTDTLRNKLNARLEADEEKIFERMVLAAKRMSSLIDDLLAYSQVSLRPHTFEEVDLNQILDLVLGDLDLEIEEKKAKVTVEKLFIVQGHHRQLQQGFHNLISNALKYSHTDRQPEIIIEGKIVSGHEIDSAWKFDNKQYYLITIADNGIGFEQQDAERIFNVFTRLHGNTDYRGTGVGLSIVRKVIENHNGFITAAGTPGNGATFQIFLPYSAPLSFA